jgi:hypothetical protein
MRNVGKDIRYKCEHGYKVKDNVPTPVAECLDTGLWSVNVECVKSKHIDKIHLLLIQSPY